MLRRCKFVNATAAICGCILLSGVVTRGQGDVAHFTVASVKKSPPPGPTFTIAPGALLPGGRWVAVNVTLRQLIRAGFPDFAGTGRIESGPTWIDSVRFDVDARTEGDVTLAQARAMVRGLLADRFGLKTHVETRQQSVWALVRSPKAGPLRSLSKTDCLAPAAASSGAATSVGPHPCVPRLSSSNGVMHLTAKSATLDVIPQMLGMSLGKPIVNRTEVVERFDLDLEFAADSLKTSDARTPASTSDAPSIHQAIQRLGLRLEESKAPVDILIVDQAHEPTRD